MARAYNPSIANTAVLAKSKHKIEDEGAKGGIVGLLVICNNDCLSYRSWCRFLNFIEL